MKIVLLPDRSQGTFPIPMSGKRDGFGKMSINDFDFITQYLQVDRSIKPEALLGHLLILSATRNVPACALHGIGGSAVPFLLGVPRVAAIGFKVRFQIVFLHNFSVCLEV